MNPSDSNPVPGADNGGAEKVAGAATQVWEATREKAGAALQSGERYVRANPGTSVLSIFGFGFLLGLLVGWAVAHEEHQSMSARMAKRWGKKFNWE